MSKPVSRLAKPKKKAGKAASPPRFPAWQVEAAAAAGIVAAGWAAHGGCLHATWFLDDWSKIVHNPDLDPARSDMGLLAAWSYRLFGGNGVACHLGNLLLHLLFALLVWRLGPLFFRHAPGVSPRVDARLASFFGALVFAVHPLCSEATHYARARDHELVGLLSFLLAAAALLWLKRGWRWFPVLLAAAVLDVLAKGPGPAHAALAVAAVLVFFGTRAEMGALLLRRWTLYAAVGLPLLAAILAPGRILEWVSRVGGTWGGGLFGLHALTQARVFWEYVWRMAVPVALCPDHLVAYTKSAGDPAAWMGLVGVALWFAGIALLWRGGRRLVAFLLFMIAANLLLRWFYVLSELMVEYRAYPSMPWLGLLAGTGLAWLYAWRRAAALAALAVVLAAGILLTRQRSAAWSSTESLTASILEQYPWQLRAVMEQTYADYRRRDADAALARLPDFYGRLRAVLAWNKASPDRAYANWPLWVVSVEGNVADCLIQAGRLDEAAAILERTRANMVANRLEDEVLWDSWRFSRAKLENRRGDYGHARLDLLRMGDWFFDPAEYGEEKKRAEEGWAAERAARHRSKG